MRHTKFLAPLVAGTVLLAACAAPPDLEDDGLVSVDPPPFLVEPEEPAQPEEEARQLAPTTTAPPTTQPTPPPAPTTTVAPTTTTPPAPPTTVAPARGAFAGDVAPGFVRWGAAVGGNSDPVRHEGPAGVPMGLRRTFFAWRHIDSNYMRNTAAADLAAGRLPWVSIKTPGNWAEVAAGQHDAALNKAINQLKALNGPVWFTVHHEPENDTQPRKGLPAHGTAADWRNMQRHVSRRIAALGADNVAFASVLMSWTFDSRSGRNPADWYVEGVFDFAGIDHYSQSESNTTMELTMWNNARAFYTARGLKIAVAEWGNRGTNAEAAAEMQAFYDMAIASGRSSQTQVIGLAYFDSDLNSPNGGWSLLGDPLQRFRQLMKAPTSLRAHQSGF